MPTRDELNEWMLAVAARSDRTAFAALFKHFAPRVKAFVMRSGTAAEIADEIAQDTMLKLWRQAASFDPERAQLSTWVFTIARNLRVDRLRSDAREVETSAESDDQALAAVDPDPGPAERLAALRLESGVRDALAALPAEQAQILKLSFFDERPHAAIAEELAIPLGTVKSRIRLAVGHLRRLLERFEP